MGRFSFGSMTWPEEPLVMLNRESPFPLRVTVFSIMPSVKPTPEALHMQFLPYARLVPEEYMVAVFIAAVKSRKMEQILSAKFKKYGFRDVHKFMSYVKNKAYKVSDDELRAFFTRYHKRRFIKRYDKSLMGNKFSSIRNAWQMDIFIVGEKTSGDEPLLYLLLVNINTRYAWIKRLKNKSSESVIEALKEFVAAFRPKIIESDSDAAFLHPDTVKFLNDNDVIYRIAPKDYKDYLSIIDKVCQTLNKQIYDGEVNDDDMSENEDEELHYDYKDDDGAITSRSDGMPEAEEVSVFDENSTEDAADLDVEAIVDKYNKTFNYAIGMTPRQMQMSKYAEIKYIYHQFEVRDEKDKMNLKRELKVGDKVRYVLDRDMKERKFEKARNKLKLSQYYYVISRHPTPYLYEIIAKDGTVKPVPRYRLFKIDSLKNIEWAPSIKQETYRKDNKPILNIKSIDEYLYDAKHPSTRSCWYKVKIVKFAKGGRSKVIKSWITVEQLRIRFNIINRMSDIEREFLDKHRDTYKWDSDSMLMTPL